MIIQRGMTCAPILDADQTANYRNAPSMGFTHWAELAKKQVALSTEPFKTNREDRRNETELPLLFEKKEAS